MGLSSGKFVYAWYRHGQGGRNDRAETARDLRARRRRRRRRYLACLLGLCVPFAAIADPDPIRIAFYRSGLTRSGPGLLLRDILDRDPQVLTEADLLARAQADVVVLAGVDFDEQSLALTAFLDLPALEQSGFQHIYSALPNRGRPSGLDLDGDGRSGTARDALSFAEFSGKKGMAVLSKYPVRVAADGHFTEVLWRDVPGARPPEVYFDRAFAAGVASVLPLSSTVHWNLVVDLPGFCPLRLFSHHASTPAFDTAQDENGRRNADENQLWFWYLDGEFGAAPPKDCFLIAADFNLDPFDGEGNRALMRRLLRYPRIQDPRPVDPTDLLSGQPGREDQSGPSDMDTADWSEENGPGNLRVDYVLPSADFRVLASGLIWPDDAKETANSGRHALVWVDLVR